MEYEFYGKHLILELKEIININLLDDVESIEKFFIDVCDKCGFSILSIHSHKFEPQGLTTVAILSESHISVHTYPDKKSCFLDCFTCGNTDPEKSLKYILDFFKPLQHTVKIIERK